MAETLEIILKANDKASAKIKALGKTANTTFTELNSLLSLGTRAFRELSRVVDVTVGAFGEYGRQVGDAARLTGGTAEEMSRLIQVADDVQISYEELTASLQFAVRQGIRPNVDGISRLADEYVALGDPVARGQLLFRNFGRSGANMGRILERGSEGVRAMADAIADGLILTEAGVQSAIDYQEAVDNLGDAWTALGMTVGGEVAPRITQDIQGLTLLFSDFGQWMQVVGFMATHPMVEFKDAVVAVRGDVEAAFVSLPGAMGPPLDEAASLVEDVRARMQAAAGAERLNLLSNIFAPPDPAQAAASAIEAIEWMQGPGQQYMDAIMDVYRGAISGVMDPEVAKGLLTDLGLGAAGLAVQEGDEKLREVAQDAAALFDLPFNEAWSRISAALKTQVIDTIPSQIMIDVGFNFTNQIPEGLGIPGGQHGLSMMVPPGFDESRGRPFLLAASSGERVDITPEGQGGKGGLTINGGISINNGLDQMAFERLLRRSLGSV